MGSRDKGLDSLEVWRRSLDFAKQIHKDILPLLPPEEKWALSQQLRRSSQSISANIAEGYGRYYYQEGVRFSYIARGSLEESCSFLTLAFELGYVPENIYNPLSVEAKEISKMLNGYIAFLKRSKRGENEPGSGYSLREDKGYFHIAQDTIYEDPDP